MRIAVGWLQIGPCVVTAEELGQCSGVTRSGDDREGEGMSYSAFQGEATRGSLIFIGILRIHNVLYFGLLGDSSIFS